MTRITENDRGLYVFPPFCLCSLLINSPFNLVENRWIFEVCLNFILPSFEADSNEFGGLDTFWFGVCDVPFTYQSLEIHRRWEAPRSAYSWGRRSLGKRLQVSLISCIERGARGFHAAVYPASTLPFQAWFLRRIAVDQHCSSRARVDQTTMLLWGYPQIWASQKLPIGLSLKKVLEAFLQSIQRIWSESLWTIHLNH